MWSWLSPEIEAATEALADRTPDEAVLMQEEINFRELGIKPLPLALLAWLFMSQISKFTAHRGVTGISEMGPNDESRPSAEDRI